MILWAVQASLHTLYRPTVRFRRGMTMGWLDPKARGPALRNVRPHAERREQMKKAIVNTGCRAVM